MRASTTTRSTTRRAACCTRTIARGARPTWPTMSFNTAIARLFELNNHLTQVVQQRGSAPREVVTPMVLMVAPLAPHIAEELWARLGHAETLAYEAFPTADPALLVDDAVEVPVQVKRQGARPRITVPVGADDATHEAARARGRPHRRTARRRHGPEGHRRARPPRQLRRIAIAMGRTSPASPRRRSAALPRRRSGRHGPLC